MVLPFDMWFRRQTIANRRAGGQSLPSSGRNRSLVAYDADYSAENPHLGMSANVNLATPSGTVTVRNRSTGVVNTLRVVAVVSCP
jgi:hypothetical protein